MDTPPLRVALVPGALTGVGPQLLLKALVSYQHNDSIKFLWCGSAQTIHLGAQHADITLDFLSDSCAKINRDLSIEFFDDVPVRSSVEQQAEFLKKATSLAKSQAIDALVTGPIDKACLKYLDDGTYHGQTEYFARHLAKDQHKPFMAFMGGPFLMSLLTTHLPLRRVADALSIDAVVHHVETVAHLAGQALAKSVADLKIAVLGLNPHAGESGLIGHEENEIIIPAIKTLRDRGINTAGPLAADGFFAYFHRMPKADTFDVVVAMYHDQGLIPYKLLAQGQAVNVTLGLTIPRTSPAHGTA